MPSPQIQPPRIITVRKTESATSGGKTYLTKAKYDFYLRFEKSPDVGKSACGGVVVSSKRLPKIFSELPDAIYDKCWNGGWGKIGRIECRISYSERCVEDMMPKYFPKEGIVKEVKRLGYYLDSISTSNAVREFGVTTIGLTENLKSNQEFGNPPPRKAQLEHVGMEVSEAFPPDFGVREYLLGMGRGIREKVEIAGKHKDEPVQA